MTAIREFSLSALTTEELDDWESVAQAKGWSEIAYDVREQQQRNMDRPGPSRSV